LQIGNEKCLLLFALENPFHGGVPIPKKRTNLSLTVAVFYFFYAEIKLSYKGDFEPAIA